MTFRFKGLVALAATAALTATPALAEGNAAAKLSLAPKATRVAAPAKNGSKIAAGGTATLINIGILAALSAGVLLATTGGNDSDSN